MLLKTDTDSSGVKHYGVLKVGRQTDEAGGERGAPF